ncbi:MAG: hypothetical protein ABL994_04910 [Verrucomicrobiales bacterium]
MNPLRPQRIFRSMGISFLLICQFVTASVRAGKEVVVLAPDSPILSNEKVPFLHEVISEHHLSGDGLELSPVSDPYDWTKVGPTEEPFQLKVGVDSAQFEHATLSVWNWNNHLVGQWRIEAGEPETIAIQIKALGTYLLTLDGWREGACQKRLIRNLAVTRDLNEARATWKADEFFLGICAFPGRYHWTPGGQPTLPEGLTEQQARDHEADLIARLGLQVVRTDESLEMGRRKNARGEDEYYFDFARMDAAVASYTSRGFQLALQTMNAADWAVLPPYADQGKNRWRYPHQEKPQRAYLAALVERYRDQSRFVQISNEPDQIGYWSGTNEEFVTQFTFSRDEIRRVAPGLPITNGGYSLVDEAKCAYFIDRLHGLVDLPAYNAHGNLEDYKRSFATMKRLQAAAGDTATGWINTETGYSAWRLEQERRQAQIDAQKVLYSWANGHAGVLLFCSRMTRGPGRDGPPDFGLLDYQYCPRFVYGSIATLTGTLTSASFRETLVESKDIHLYVFERGEDLIVAGFTLGEEAATALIESDAKEVIAVDEMGNEGGPAAGGGSNLTLDAYPRYWVLRGATRVGMR